MAFKLVQTATKTVRCSANEKQTVNQREPSLTADGVSRKEGEVV